MKKTLLPSFLLFLIQLFVLLFVYNLKDELHKEPHSIHTWRQCDGAATGLHYYTFKNSLWQPMFYNMHRAQGEAGSEFPIVYWLAAKLSPETGFEASNIRYIHFAFCLLFLWVANAVCIEVTRSWVLAFFASFLPFFSTVFSFYAGNFLSDAPAACLVMTSLGLLYFYGKKRNNWLFAASLLAATLGGLLKVTALAPYLTVLFIGFIEVVFNKQAFGKKIFPTVAHWLLSLLPLLLIAGWLLYIKHYNSVHNSFCYRTIPYPLWTLNDSEHQEFIWGITGRWANEYLSVVTTKIMLLLIPVVLYFSFRKNVLFGVAVLFFVLLQTLIVLLFAGQFFIHDYYAIMLVSTPVVLFLLLFYFAGRQKILPLLLSLVVIPYSISEIVYTSKRLNTRYADKGWGGEIFVPLRNCLPELEKNGLAIADKVLVLEDPSPCISLYALQRKGWTTTTACLNYEQFEKEGDFLSMKERGLKWIVFPPHTQEKYPCFGDMPFEKRFTIGDCEFIKLKP
jgi:hypothetical protein